MTIQRHWHHMVHKTNTNKTNQIQNTICGGHHYSQQNRNNVNKIWVLIQTTGGKDEPDIVFMLKLQRTSRHYHNNPCVDILLHLFWCGLHLLSISTNMTEKQQIKSTIYCPCFCFHSFLSQYRFKRNWICTGFD